MVLEKALKVLLDCGAFNEGEIRLVVTCVLVFVGYRLMYVSA